MRDALYGQPDLQQRWPRERKPLCSQQCRCFPVLTRGPAALGARSRILLHLSMFLCFDRATVEIAVPLNILPLQEVCVASTRQSRLKRGVNRLD